jgi:hypothetical protein
VTHPSRLILTALLLMALAVCVLGVAAAPAAAKSKTPCWKTLINDWYDGRIDGTYPIHCYREALNHLPTDVETYSSARDDIKQALQKRLTQGKGNTGGGTGTTGGSSSTPGGGTKGDGGSSGTPSSGGTDAAPGKGGGGKNTSGPIGDALGKPGKADSVPVPLIVLGAVALLLMAAGGAGFVARRMRTRKLQLAAAATLPQRPPGSPPETR